MDRKIALLIEYDGTKYYGFQFQPNFPTIQGEIENALNNLNLSNERIEGAGRTDTGVHAKGQMASFITNSNLDIQDIESGINLISQCGKKEFFNFSSKIYGLPKGKLRDGKTTPLDLANRFSSVMEHYKNSSRIIDHDLMTRMRSVKWWKRRSG